MESVLFFVLSPVTPCSPPFPSFVTPSRTFSPNDIFFPPLSPPPTVQGSQIKPSPEGGVCLDALFFPFFHSLVFFQTTLLFPFCPFDVVDAITIPPYLLWLHTPTYVRRVLEGFLNLSPRPCQLQSPMVCPGSRGSWSTGSAWWPCWLEPPNYPRGFNTHGGNSEGAVTSSLDQHPFWMLFVS